MSYSMDNRPGKGSSIYTRKLIEGFLADPRIDLTLVHYDKVDDPIYLQAHEIIMPPLKLPMATRFVRQLLFFWQYRQKKFDVIQWCQPRVYPFFWFAPARHKIVTPFCGGDIAGPGAYPLSRRMFNFTLKHFNHKFSALIASSDFGKGEIVEYYKADPVRVHVVYLAGGEGYEPLPKAEVQEQVRAKYKVMAPFILDVSRLDTHKNVARVIQAYDHARKRGGLKHKLVIVGYKGDDSPNVKAVAQASPYVSDILFVNYVEAADLNAMYSAADLFIFPSLNEGFGLPLIEAFASGVPIITSNTTSIPEVVVDAAVTVDPLDPDAMGEAIIRVLADEHLRSELIRKGLVRAKEFTWKKTAERTADIYCSLASDVA